MTRNARALSLCLAAAVLAACGEEAVGPLRDPNAKTPGPPSFYTAVEQASIDTARAREAATRLMESVVLGSSTAGALTVTTTSPVLTSKASKDKGRTIQPGPITANYYPLEECTLDYIDCVQKCLETRIDFQNSASDFWRADSDFWDNLLTGRSYLNGLSSGPTQQMRNSFYLMGQYRNRYQSLNCRKYLS